MSYNREDYIRIKAESSQKYLRAQNLATERRGELYAAIPEVWKLDGMLSRTGMEIMEVIRNGSTNMQAKMEEIRRRNEELLARRGELLRSHGYPENYSDIQYECDKCGDTGFVDTKMCDCMRRALILAGYESSGLGALIRTQSFDNFSLDYYRQKPQEYEIMTRNYHTVRRYAEQFSMSKKHLPQSLLFLGGTGLGKTHLSTAVARTVIARGYDVFYNSAVGMISDFECRRFGNGLAQGDGDDTARYTECDLLIIDDLGTEVVNQFTLSCLYHVLNTRLNLQKPTLISTNLTSGELRKIYSDRITSRLLGEYLLIPFYGTDVRRQKTQD